jgi:hypothetical protein
MINLSEIIIGILIALIIVTIFLMSVFQQPLQDMNDDCGQSIGTCEEMIGGDDTLGDNMRGM